MPWSRICRPCWTVITGSIPIFPDLHSVVSGHLTQGGRSLGFTEVVNPSAETFHSTSLLLATLTRFFAILLRNRNSRRILEHNSRTDPPYRCREPVCLPRRHCRPA